MIINQDNPWKDQNFIGEVRSTEMFCFFFNNIRLLESVKNSVSGENLLGIFDIKTLP